MERKQLFRFLFLLLPSVEEKVSLLLLVVVSLIFFSDWVSTEPRVFTPPAHIGRLRPTGNRCRSGVTGDPARRWLPVVGDGHVMLLPWLREEGVGMWYDCCPGDPWEFSRGGCPTV